MHIATKHNNNHAAIPLRSANTDSRNAKNYAHRNNHSLQNTDEEPQRPHPHPPHRGGTFHRRPQPLYTEKHKVSCSGFLPKTKPMQHSCSHCNAFHSIPSQTCTYLRTQQQSITTIMQPFQCDLQPQIQETQRTMHTGTTTRCKTQNCSGFLPKINPCNIHAAITMRFAASRRKPARIYSHSNRQQSMTTIMQPIQCDPQPQIQDTHRITVKSHATLHQGQCFSDVLLCNVKSYTTHHQGQFFSNVFLCNVKSHTTLHQGQIFSDVLLYSVKSHTTLHQCQFFSDVLLCSIKVAHHPSSRSILLQCIVM